MENVVRDALFEERRIGAQGTLVFIFVVMRGHKISAVGGARDTHFALRATADGTDFSAFRGTIARSFALFTNRTVQVIPLELQPQCGRIRRVSAKDKIREGSGQNDFVVKTSRGDDQKKRANGKQSEAVKSEMTNAAPAQNYAARDVDKVAGGNEVADNVKDFGHSFAREDIAGEKDAGQDSQKGQRHGLRLRIGLAGNQNAQ